MNKLIKLLAICAAVSLGGCDNDTDVTVPTTGEDTHLPHVTPEDSDSSPPKTCKDECTENQTECDDESTLKKCTKSDDGCWEWTTKTCPQNTICTNGKCKHQADSECQDECTENDVQCDGDTALKTCKADENGCLKWVSENCPENTACSENECKTKTTNPDDCQDECTENDVQCDGETALKTCKADENGCLKWVSENCPENTACSENECKTKTTNPDECQDECTENDVQCDGETALKTCKAGENGCLKWVSENCPENTACSENECKTKTINPECQNECTANAVQCDGESKLKTCKADQNGCLKWNSQNCPKDTTCSGNECKAKAPQCKNQCSGTTQCDGTSGYKTCKDTNGDGCKEWTAVTKCPSGQECKNGACAAIACKYKSTTDPGIHPLPGEGSYGKSEATTKNGYSDEYLYDADNYIKVGVRRDWGGSIIFFGLADGNPGTNGSNTIDGNDTGREVQVAIYDASRQMQGCAYNASCGSSPQCPGSITYLGWNPVQGGNRCNRGSGVQSVTNKNGILEVVTVPLHWNPNWDDATGSCTSNGCDTSATWARKSDVTLTQRLRFVRKHVAELFYSVHNDGNLNHTASHQELPTLYATYGAHGFGNYNRLMTASKEQIHINEEANDGFFTKAFKSAEPWVTLQNANLDYGVGILYENGLLDYQGWQKDGMFNNVRSLIKFGLPPNGTVNARAYLILGSYDLIASEAKTLMSTLPPFGVLDIPDGKTAVTGNVSLSGWALDNRGVTKVTARIDEGTPVTLTYGADRSDVCAVWVGYPKCNKVGFSGSISVAGLSKECPHLLEIMATDTDNNTRTIARRIINVK